ncbi:MAG: rod shape-determining protein MreC [Cytophagales bacterium]|nr:rod shape-determining protein MreC [Cytophagales bacterium]
MYKVLRFFITRVNFFSFLILEIIAIALIINNNPYQSSAYFNSSNTYIARMLYLSNQLREYLNLRDINKELSEENTKLRYLLRKYSEQTNLIYSPKDSTMITKYTFIPAKVINTSTSNFHNYITINKGMADSVKPGMAVINTLGVVGKVKSCSEHFATISSMLHKEIMVSSKHKKSGNVCTVKWDGKDPFTASLLYLPRHILLQKGDTILTSGYNAVFPEGEPIGTVSYFDVKPYESFYQAEIKYFVDFYSLNYVYVIKNKFLSEQDSLETNTKNILK